MVSARLRQRVCLPLTRYFLPMKKVLPGFFKDYNKESDTIRFIASSGSVDRDGESLMADGWVLDNFKRNPVLLWSHDAKELPIGRVTDVYVEGNNLIAETEFAVKDPFAKRVFDLVKDGFLKAVSVGFMPLEYNAAGETIKQELLELSVVNVPANQEALMSNQYQAFIKSLDKAEKKEIETVEKKEEPKKEEPEQKEVKEGRTISEKNRNTMRIAMDSMNQATSALNELLQATEPPDKKGGNKHEQLSEPRDKRIYKSVRLMDRVVEAVIHELKDGGEK